MGEDGEIIPVSGDKVSGPWNKSGAPPPSSAAAAAASTAAAAAAAAAPAGE